MTCYTGGAGWTSPRTCHSLRTHTRVLLNLHGVASDQQGLKADLLMPTDQLKPVVVEVKTGKTVRPSMAAPLLSCIGLAQTVRADDRSPPKVPLTTAVKQAIACRVEALDIERFIQVVRTR